MRISYHQLTFVAGRGYNVRACSHDGPAGAAGNFRPIRRQTGRPEHDRLSPYETVSTLCPQHQGAIVMAQKEIYSESPAGDIVDVAVHDCAPDYSIEDIE